MAADTELVVATLVAVLALAFVAIQSRRAVLFRRGATVACAWRPTARARWQGGVVRFDPDALRAYRIVGVRTRPFVELPRGTMSVAGRTPASSVDRRRLMHDPVVLAIHSGDARWDLAVGSDTVPGLMAWLEGRPVN